ncbi:MAG: glycosyltransferase family 2 protein [Hyphomicrobiaceae bacterium]
MTNISVVIPTCDRPMQLVAALQSVLAQTAQPKEIVIVDNGVMSVVPENLPCRVILERLPAARVGVSRARNVGAEKAGSTYVAFLDDDDTWEPDYLEYMASAIANAPQPPDLLLGRIDIVRGGKQQAWKYVGSARALMPKILYGNPGVGGTNIVVRRQAFQEIGGFDEAFICSEDRALALEFWMSGAQIECVSNAVAIASEIHGGPQLRGSAKLAAGRKQFIKKYRSLMVVDEWLAAHAQILAIRARNNRVYWPLLKSLQGLRRLVARFPNNYKNMLTRYVRAGAPEMAPSRRPIGGCKQDINLH